MKKTPLSSLITGIVFACAFVLTKKMLSSVKIEIEKKEGAAQDSSKQFEASNASQAGVVTDVHKVSKPVKKSDVSFEKISMSVDFPYISEPGTSPIIRNGRTMLPMHALAKLMGVGCAWNEYTQTVTLASSSCAITMTLGSNVALVDNEEVVSDCAAINFKGVVFLPVRFIAENLGCKVEWHESKRELIIKK